MAYKTVTLADHEEILAGPSATGDLCLYQGRDTIVISGDSIGTFMAALGEVVAAMKEEFPEATP